MKNPAISVSYFTKPKIGLKASLYSIRSALLFSLALIISPFASGQDSVQKLDSIYRVCLQNPSDTAALNDFNSIQGRLYSQHRDTVKFYAQEQVRLANKAGHDRLEARGYNMWGICVEIGGDLDSAITLYEIAKSIGETTGDGQLMVDIYNNLGIVFSFKGLFESSLEYTLKSLEIAESHNDSARMSMMYNNIGLRYSELGYQEKAIGYYKKAMILNLAFQNKNRLCNNYTNLGVSYYKLARIDTAIYFYKKALRYARETDNSYSAVNAANGMATAYMKEKKYALAETYIDSALTWAMDNNDEYGVEYSTLMKGYLAHHQGEYKEAIPILENALIWFEKGRYFNEVQDINMNLADSYHQTGNDTRAFRYMRDFAFAKDSSYTRQKDLAMEQVAIFKEAQQQREKELLNQKILLRDLDIQNQKALRNTFIAIGVLLLLLAIGLANRYFYEKRTKRALAEKNKAIEKERARSEELLLNILPSEVAEELKALGKSEARDFENVTVLFTDFVEFTQTAAKLSAKDLVSEINTCFEAFDEIITRHKLEKIKTIGDAYMAAGGLHIPRTSEPRDVVRAALEMQQFMIDRKAIRTADSLPAFDMRVGIHTGPVVAGIVGVKKFQYDIWGDTVNTASRMESSGQIGQVNISQSTYDLIKEDEQFTFQSRGKIEAKGKGELEMFFVNLIKTSTT